ncbi:hypothetical protein ACI2K4_13480 [Micromonospora sp. NPDC050397]|uniref:hypothetical protein n=1 Tax=Micromonospora sp. NPDC050397 TaxID=3364279 RepID=UPI00384D644F
MLPLQQWQQPDKGFRRWPATSVARRDDPPAFRINTERQPAIVDRDHGRAVVRHRIIIQVFPYVTALPELLDG